IDATGPVDSVNRIVDEVRPNLLQLPCLGALAADSRVDAVSKQKARQFRRGGLLLVLSAL
ncbi:MAG TPA: hypothetical protein VFS35_10500, partial [Terrimicrobiaceae bacterium]|nr:hypothetical protein [Terrimicrobiaceae bacterium]